MEAIRALGRPVAVHAADVRDHAAAARVVDAVITAFGRLDILVCNAGITWDGVIWKMTEEQWDRVHRRQPQGLLQLQPGRRAASSRTQKYGKIVNISSINGLRGKFGQANYAASKGGRDRDVQERWPRSSGKFNVNVNVVAPGMVLTEMTRTHPAEVLEQGARRDGARALRDAGGRGATSWPSSARIARDTSPAR